MIARFPRRCRGPPLTEHAGGALQAARSLVGQNEPMARERQTWVEMQSALRRARDQATDVMRIIASARDRSEAAQALASLVGCSPELADQLLDVHLAEFIGTSAGA